MVVEETLRLFPPAFAINRMALAEDRIGGHVIHKGTLITISPYVTHRNPRLWPSPTRFEPERFAPDQVAARPRFAYLPFGGGPRVCIGNSFAMMEATILLAQIAQKYRLLLDPRQRVEAQGLITLRPRFGMRMILEPRVPQRI
jgi:cytochrome P450